MFERNTPSVFHIDDHFSAAGQIHALHVASLAAMGFKTIINNRPDDEEPGQPSHQSIQEAAEQVGLIYHFFPIDAYTFESMEDVEQYAQLLEKCPTPILAFCRVGARVQYAYQLVQLFRRS